MKRRFTELDGLRGVLAFMVVLSHIPAQWYEIERIRPAWESLLWHLGAPAVDGFFVISGFVITHALSVRARGNSHYLQDRAARLLPLAAIGIAAGLLVKPVSGLIASTTPLLKELAPTSGVFLRQYAAPLNTTDIIGILTLTLWPFNANHVNPPLWSLTVETQVALLMPLLIALGIKYRYSALPLLILAGMVLEAFGWRSAIHLSNFMWGILLYQSRITLTGQLKIAALATGLSLYFVRHLTDLEWSLLRPVSGTGFALIMLVLLSTPRLQRPFQGRVAQWLGTRSYALYIIHFPVMFLFSQVTAKNLHMGFITGAALSIPVSLLLADLLHRHIELPLARRWRSEPIKDARCRVDEHIS